MYYFLLLVSFCLCQFAQATLEIQGAPKQIEENIQKRIAYKMNLTSDVNEQVLDQIRKETEEAIKPYGYFAPTVSVTTDTEDEHIYIHVTLNKLAHIRSIDVEYTDLPDNPRLEALIEEISRHYLHSPFNNQMMDQISDEIKETAIGMGYSDVVITRGYTSINRQTHLGDITYLITFNDKNIFGDISYPRAKDEHCFYRFHDIKEGDYYDPKKLRDFQKNMMNSGLYTRSNIQTIPRKGTPHIQDIVVDYDPIKPVQFFLGFGVKANINESKLSPQAQADIDFNDVGGCGNTLKIGVRGSTIGGQFHINALFPKASGINNFNMVSAKINTENYTNNDSSDFFRVTGLIQHYAKPWTHQSSVNFLIERSTLNANTVDKSDYVTKLFFPKYRLIARRQTKYSNMVFKAKAIAGADSLFSDIDFLQIGYTAFLNTKIKGLYASNQISYGKIFTKEFDKYPLSMQYYLGGPNSNRGLSYHQLNEGKEFLLSRNQVQVGLKHNVLLGVFFDTGFCTNPSRTSAYYPAYGVLTSYVTSYGSLECSIGRLVDDTKWVILVNIVPGADVL